MLTVAAAVAVQIGAAQTFTDNGTLTLGSGDSVSFPAAQFATTQLVVNSGGVVNAASTNFSTPGNASGSLTQIVVNSGGELIAASSTFGVNQLVLESGSILSSTDLTNDTFNLPLYLPALDIPLLANNLSFHAIEIFAGTLSTGQSLSLNQIGTATTANLVYVFTGAFTIQAGGSLTVAAAVAVQIGAAQTFTDGGTLTFGSGDSVSFPAAQFATTQLVVNSGGVVNAASTNFSTPGNASGSLTQIVVNSGGELIAASSTFGVNQLVLANGSVLNPGDLTNDVFNLPIYVPALDVPLLTNNQSFGAININGGSLSAGQSLTLGPIGTKLTANLYIFPSGFTIQAGGSLTVAAAVAVQIGAAQTFTDGGTLTLGSGDSVSFLTAQFATTQLVVNSGGVVNAASTNFTNPGNASGSLKQIVVNSGGELIATGSTFGVNQMTLNAGSTDTLQFVAFATQLTINSGATISIHSDDFSSTSASVVAAGASTATIDLTNNFWGTLNTTQIAAKITDHSKNSSLPTVLYQPFLTEDATGTYAANASVIYSPNAQTVTLSATVISANGPVNGGTATFTIQSGSNVIGTPVTANVVSGAASGTYTIPAGTLGGVYTIQAVFSGTSTLSGSSDSSHTLTIGGAATTTAAQSATAIFSASNQTISLSATVTSSAGIVNDGTETFTILSGTTPVGTPATASVSQGAVTSTYTLPGGTAVGAYTIEAVYNGTVDYATSTDTSQSLTVSAAGPTITWNTTTAPTGGDWDTPGNWVGGVVPTASNNVVINLTSSGTVTHSTGANDAVLSLTTNANTALSIGSGSIALGNRSSSIGSVTIGTGAVLSVAAGASVTIQANKTITDNGALNFGSGSTALFAIANQTTTQILVNGTMSATGTTFNLGGNNASLTQIQVNSGGELTATGSTFNLNQLVLESGSILSSTDLTNDTFNLPVYVPALDIPNLANNLSFQAIEILGGASAPGSRFP